MKNTIPQETKIKIILFKLTARDDFLHLHFYSKKDIVNAHVSCISRFLSNQKIKDSSRSQIIKNLECKKSYWDKNGIIFSDYGDYTIFTSESELKEINRLKNIHSDDLGNYFKIHNDELIVISDRMIRVLLSSYPILTNMEKKWKI